MKKETRKYDASRRRNLAEATRAQILSAARSLFGDVGYTGTTIDQIARRAGVAVPTLYATLGGKRAILLKLLDQMENAADGSALHSQIAERAGDEHAQLRIFVNFTVRLFAGGVDLLRIAELAGVSDPDVGALWDLGEARRLESCRCVLDGWAQRHRLRKGLAENRAVDILWALSGPETYLLFVRKRGWTPAQFGEWMYQTAGEQLLRPDQTALPAADCGHSG